MFRSNFRLWAIVLVCLFVSVGCAGLQAKRGVEGNVFYSSSRPKLNIEFGSGFKFIGDNTQSGSQFMVDSARSTNIEKEIYSFRNTAQNKNINIHFHRIGANRVRWNQIDLKGIKNLIEVGVETINGSEYQYGVYPVSNKNGCFLVKLVGRIFGGEGDTKMLIYYVERLGNSSSFSKWTNKDTFTGRQRKRIRGFLEAFKEDVKIMDYSEVTS